MAQSTTVVINCIGPYYIYGEVVVKSCVLTSTHYVDVTGESLVSDTYRLFKFRLIVLYVYIYWDPKESTNILTVFLKAC